MSLRKISAAIVVVVIIAIGIAVYFLWISKKNDLLQSSLPIPSPADVSASQATSPDAATISCYKTYIAYFGSAQAHQGTSDYTSFISRCFTETYINRWQGFIQSTEVDPVLLAQDFAPSWISNQYASIKSNDSMVSEVALTLGTSTEAKVLTVDLINSNGVWKIDSVHQAMDGK